MVLAGSAAIPEIMQAVYQADRMPIGAIAVKVGCLLESQEQIREKSA
jgi:hypothetical protein